MSNDFVIGRRDVLTGLICGGALTITGNQVFAGAGPSKGQSKSPIAETTAGKVRGAISEGVCVFKGIPYGASTAGANRFMAPKKPVPWKGVRDALSYGPIAMQEMSKWPEPWGTITKGNMTWDGHERSEDCLVLNVWTPALNDGKKRPVMVWYHGGGFNNGSGDADWHDGTQLARKHDVVVVHSNHRLNIFGYLYLAQLGGEKYADSGNAGMLDIVAVLQWVRDNIERFGGDPANVTVFGESGGGVKVTTLMAMPAAKGLFHKAIVQSGPALDGLSPEAATHTAKEVLDRLGISLGRIDALQTIDPDKLLQIKKEIETARGTADGMLRPVVDGRSLPRHPFEPDAPDISANVPMLIGTTKDESRYLSMFDPKLASLNEAGVREQLKDYDVPEAKRQGLIQAFQATRPGESPSDVYMAIISHLVFRKNAILQAERKYAQGAAPAYMYLFTWESPEGLYRSGHNLEVPFVFANPDMAPSLRGPNPDPRYYGLADNVSAAWVAFARTGNPTHRGIPEWKPYDPKGRATMLLDYTCELVEDPLRQDRLAVEALGA
jgi:para-nitrobenzyl esterase